MKRTWLKVLALTMALLMLICVTSCQSKDKKPAESNDDETQPLTDADILGFEKQNYNREFKILANNGYAFTARDFCVDAADAEADNLSRAIYERELACEEYLGLSIEITPQAGKYNDGMAQKLHDLVASGDCDYDMVAMAMGQIIGCGYINIFKNIMKMEYINLDHDWWVDGTIDQLSINNQLYLIAGDACQSTYTYIGCTYVNLAVAENFGVEVDFYDTVRKGDWTLDTFFTLFKQVSKDNDGDNQFNAEIDTYGWCNHDIGARFMWTAAGIEMIQRQPDGTFALRADLDSRIYDLVDKFKLAFDDPHSTYVGGQVEGDTKMAKTFADDRVLFVTSYLAQAENFKNQNMESPFAILPMPKYDENQKDYIASNSGTYNALCFPVTITSTELSAKVAEFMGYYGQEHVIPEYYDVALKYRQNDVEQNIEMIDLLREKLIVTPNESYGSISPDGDSAVMYYTQLTNYTTGNAGDGSKAFYKNPSSIWATKSPAIAKAIKSYVMQYYQVN